MSQESDPEGDGRGLRGRGLEQDNKERGLETNGVGTTEPTENIYGRVQMPSLNFHSDDE